MNATEKMQVNLNRLLGNGGIKAVTVDPFNYSVDDDGNPERITIEFENGKKVTIQASSIFDGCGDLDTNILFIEDSTT